MLGAGKRKLRKPARYADFQLDDAFDFSDWPDSTLPTRTSPAQRPTSRERLESALEGQLAEVSREIERLHLDQAMITDADEPALPTTNTNTVRASRAAVTSTPEIPRDYRPKQVSGRGAVDLHQRRARDTRDFNSAYPTLKDIRRKQRTCSARVE